MMASQEYVVVIYYRVLPSEKKNLVISFGCSPMNLVVSLTLQVYALTNQYKIKMVNRENLIDGHPICGDAVTAYKFLNKKILGKKNDVQWS